MSISDFFENTLGSKLVNSRWSWGAFNPDTNQLLLRVWDDQLYTVDGVEHITILGKNWAGKSPGLPERRRHVEILNNGAEGYGVLCTARNYQTIGNRVIEKFNRDLLLKFGELIVDNQTVYARVIECIPVKELASYNLVVSDLKSILGAPEGATTKEA